MKKRIIALVTALCLLLCALSASAQQSTLPLYDVYPVCAGDNAWFEVPVAYDVYETPSSFPILGIIDTQAEDMMAANAVFAYIPEGLQLQKGDMDVRGFAAEGRAVLSGTQDTGESRVIERYQINDLPAVRVEMVGQGFEMIWVGDEGDMYFFMYPTVDADFAAAIRATAATLHLVESRTAPACNPDDYIWTDDENGVTIAGYTGEASRIAIPSEIGGKPVVALNDAAFYEADVTWVSIPDSVTRIGKFCFGGCTLLQTLRLPAGLTEISDGLFESCFRLYEVTLPEGVTSIGDNAFWVNYYLTGVTLPASLTHIGSCNFVGCECLAEIIVAPGNTAFSTADDGRVLLSADGKRFIHYCAWQERSVYTVPAGVEVIDSFAFGSQPQLRSVIVPEGVTTIGGAAFIRVTGLQSLTLPASAVNLGMITMSMEGGILLPTPEGDNTPRTITICSDAVIIAPEGSAAQQHAEMFNLIFEAAQTAENTQ